MNPVNTKPYQLPTDATWFAKYLAFSNPLCCTNMENPCKVTGCSSGIGRAIAELVASKPGHRLIATARNPSSLSYLPNDNNGKILKLALDVTLPASVGQAFHAAAKHFEDRDGGKFHIDILVNNAGYELAGDTEERD